MYWKILFYEVYYFNYYFLNDLSCIACINPVSGFAKSVTACLCLIVYAIVGFALKIIISQTNKYIYGTNAKKYYINIPFDMKFMCSLRIG